MKPLYLVILSAFMTMGHFGVWVKDDNRSGSSSGSSYRSYGSGSSYSGTSGGHK